MCKSARLFCLLLCNSSLVTQLWAGNGCSTASGTPQRRPSKVVHVRAATPAKAAITRLRRAPVLDHTAVSAAVDALTAVEYDSRVLSAYAIVRQTASAVQPSSSSLHLLSGASDKLTPDGSTTPPYRSTRELLAILDDYAMRTRATPITDSSASH